jgi:tRNA (uracil-5-)-methyltransferase TRM9
MPPRTLETVIIEGKPELYEDLNVHAIYDEIAPHFASTRYKVK